jgi:hypothetical protein
MSVTTTEMLLTVVSHQDLKKFASDIEWKLNYDILVKENFATQHQNHVV